MSDTHWRNSMKPVRFFFMDARAAIPFVFVLVHLRWYTLVIAAVTTLIFYILETRGLNFISALRAFRVWLVTRKRPNIKHTDRTRLVDFSFEPAFERPPSPQNEEAPPIKGKPSASAAKVKKASGGAANQKQGQNKGKTVKPPVG